jgi:hypothetical protein
MPRYRAPTSSTWPAAACSRLAAADFFTVEVLTLGGLVRYVVKLGAGDRVAAGERQRRVAPFNDAWLRAAL